MKTILIIDDNPDILDNLSEILELANYNVLKAADGKQGVQAAIQTEPDLIICDIMMPILDGYGVLHMLQKNEQLQNVPFIFLSSKTEKEDFRKGMQLGADDYISKPFNATELLDAIEVRLKKSELLQKKLPDNKLEGVNNLVNSFTTKGSLQELRRNRKIIKYCKKQIIYREGIQPIRLYYVQKGKVKTYKSNDDGKDLITELYGEGDFFGYVALLEGTVYKETAEALQDCELAVIPREEFELLVYKDKQVASQFFQVLAKNVTEKENKLLGQAYNSLRKKVAVALLTLKEKYHSNKQELFSINISRENLATLAGTATESVIRTLSDFKNEKLIDIKENNIIIINEKKLENLIS